MMFFGKFFSHFKNFGEIIIRMRCATNANRPDCSGGASTAWQKAVLCKRPRLQKNAPKGAWISRCCNTGAHRGFRGVSAPNKHINAHTLCALNVACLGGNYTAIWRVILPATSPKGKPPARNQRTGLIKPYLTGIGARGGTRNFGDGWRHDWNRQVHAEQNVF